MVFSRWTRGPFVFLTCNLVRGMWDVSGLVFFRDTNVVETTGPSPPKLLTQQTEDL